MNAQPADLRHVDTWLFDLDNTLYPVESGFMGEIERRMTDYVERVTGLPHDEAYKLQKKYLAEYGLTLGGLVEHHGVDPHDFHKIFHDMSLEALSRDPDLVAAIARLPGRRLIFTNADDVHAERVLKRLGLDQLFDDVFDIGAADYVPKPHPATFARMAAAHDIAPRSTAFFEDREGNLAPAAELGMTTVLVGPHAEASNASFVRYKTAMLAPFLAGARLREAS
ncbi:pyrimidine 5'-nucleotidase [Phenylobacterium sp.]|jgi:putative hydrolase of the HAD superfamily|uniref:pyrimidine 5'-nucleotidase n=1 Tax=Phenylobacterium sp. TaxID=1871053 RepID=UPI002F424CEB